MGKIHLILALGIAVVLKSCCYSSDCDDDTTDDISIEPAISSYQPIYMSKDDFTDAVLITAPEPIVTSGKIYLYNNLLFINEQHKGFHMYDNTDPTLPVAINFLKIPGSTDISIRENVLYINQATDLIAITYNEESQEISITKRIPNVFPELISPDGMIPYDTPEDKVIIGWELIDDSYNTKLKM